MSTNTSETESTVTDPATDEQHVITAVEPKLMAEKYHPSTASGHEVDNPAEVYPEYDGIDTDESGERVKALDQSPTYECSCGAEPQTWKEVEEHFQAVVAKRSE